MKPASPKHPGEPDQRPELIGLYITLIAIALTASVVLLIPPLREAASSAISGDTGELRSELDSPAGVFLTLMLALLHSVVFYPAEILNAAAGFVYGFWPALGLMMAAWVMNAYVAYEIGRHAARPVLYRLFGRDRFTRYEAMIERGGVTLLLTMRLIPIVPFSLFSYVVGAARVPLPRFLWTTAVAYIPITAIFVYLGSRLESLSLTDPKLLLGAAIAIALLLGSHAMARRVLQPDPPASG